MIVTESEAVKNLADNIRTVMRIRNITTQKELARHIEIPEATLSTFLKRPVLHPLPGLCGKGVRL